MKRNLIGTLSLVVMSVVLSGMANAQTFAKADVPFAFKVGSAQLPAGTCEIRTVNDATVVIRSLEGGASALSMTRQEYSNGPAGAKLVFHRLGDHYFLTEIWKDGSGMVVPRSDEEKELEKELASKSNVVEQIKIALY